MRRKSFIVSTLLSGIVLLPMAGLLHADFVTVTGKKRPDAYDSLVGAQAQVGQLNGVYGSDKNFSKYQKGFFAVEKSMDASSDSDAIAVGNKEVSNTRPKIESAQISNPTSGGQITIGTNQMTISWNANGNPTDTLYVAEISSDPGFATITERITSSALSATFAGLNPGAQYYMRVQAVDPHSNATLPFVRFPTAVTLSPIPGGPISVTAVDRGNYQGNHYWELYWTLTPGYICPQNSSQLAINQDFVYLAHSSDSNAKQSYAGASGYSPLACQVNVYDRTDSGPTVLWFDFIQNLNGLNIPISLPANFLELSF